MRDVTGLPGEHSRSGGGQQPAGDEPPLGAARPVTEIAAELGSLAAEIAAHTCRFLQVLAEFDAQDGWQQYAGMCSCAHWLSWRCGMSTSTAREHVRVARALRSLPLTVAEFAAGRLSYSKVRAITRVGTAANEDELVGAARAASATQLDRLCAGIRTGAALTDVNARHARRRLTYRVEADGSVCFSVRSSPEDGAVILEALRRTEDYLERSGPEVDDADQDLAHADHSLLDALVLICEQSDVGAETDRAATTERVAANEPDTGAGPSPGADARAVSDLEAGSTSGSAPSAGPVAAPGDCVRASRRSETVLHATLDDLAGAATTGATATAEDVQRRAAADEGARAVIGPHLELGPALHPETARRLACDSGLVLHLHDDAPAGASAGPLASLRQRPGRTIDLGRRRRRPSAGLFRALWDRDQGCVFPGCARRRYLHAHHLWHWARGGPTNLENMALLCGEHHRALHEGGFDLRRGPDGALHTYGPDGRLVLPAPAPPRLRAGGTELLAGDDADAGPGDLTATDARPFNLGYAVSTLLVNRQLRLAAQEPGAA